MPPQAPTITFETGPCIIPPKGGLKCGLVVVVVVEVVVIVVVVVAIVVVIVVVAAGVVVVVAVSPGRRFLAVAH